jgi:hypothetical protein
MLPYPPRDPADSPPRPVAIETPNVTEIPPELEPTTNDPFIEGEPAPAPKPRRRGTER